MAPRRAYEGGRHRKASREPDTVGDHHHAAFVFVWETNTLVQNSGY